MESVDLYPTLASLAGLTPPQQLQGVSLMPVLKDATASVKPAAFTQVNRAKGEGRSVRTVRWRYTEWRGNENAAELYDEQNDPGEFTNLASDRDHGSDVAAMRALLHP